MVKDEDEVKFIVFENVILLLIVKELWMFSVPLLFIVDIESVTASVKVNV